MRKKLIHLVLLGTATYQGACQASSAVQYLTETGQNQPVGLEACKPLCVPNCQTDMANHSYRCMFGCSDLRDKKIAVCVNSQFSHYVQWRDAQLNALNQQNDAQGQQLNDLTAQMADAKAKIVKQKGKLGVKKAENVDLQNRFNVLEIKFSAEQQRLAGLVAKNQQLHDRLADANANINQKAADIAGLNAEIVANEAEITGLKVEIDDLGRVLSQIMQDYGSIVDKYEQLGTFINTQADKVRESERKMEAIAHEFAAALQLDRAAIGVWVQNNRQRLQQVQDDYARRAAEYQKFINDALEVLEGHRGDIDQEIDRLMQEYNK